MSTAFDQIRNELESDVMRLPRTKRALFLLVYAQRLVKVFELFEKRASDPIVRFEDALEGIWAVAAGAGVGSTQREQLSAAIPGEEWVVDGFHDTVAQNIGGLAEAALQGLTDEREGIEGIPETGVFDLLRLLLSEMRLGCSEPGEDLAGKQFDSTLHEESIVVEEAAFWQGLLRKLAVGSVPVDELRRFATENTFDPSRLEPDLARGLRRDGVRM